MGGIAVTSIRAAAVFAAAACLFVVRPAAALGPGGVSPNGRTPPGIIELRDDTDRVDVIPSSLFSPENGAGDAPRELGFHPDPSRFKAETRSQFRGLTEAKAFWLCFTVRSAASARTWLLVVGSNRGESVTIYAVDPDGRVEKQSVDASESPQEGNRPPTDYSFRLDIGPGEVKTVYMRFAAEGLISLRATIWDSYDYLKADEVEAAITGLVLGVVIAVFIYTFFIAISLRERAYAFYLLYLAGILLFVVASSGIGASFFWSGRVWIGKRALPFSQAIIIFSIVLFARSFLDIPRRSAILSVSLAVIAVVAALQILDLSILDLRFAMRAGNGIDVAARLIVLAAAQKLARGGRRERYFLASWAFAVAGSMLTLIGDLGFLPPRLTSLWDKGTELGALAQVLLLTYGITDAIDAIRREKEAGQRRSIELLERANRVKEDFIIGTSLEFRSPLFGIVGLVDAMTDLASEDGRLAALIKAEALRLLSRVANIAAYARLRNGDLALVAERVSLREVVEGAAGSAFHVASGKDIAVEKAVEDAELTTDARVLGQIAYDLFADAFKRSPSGIVRIEGLIAGDRVRLAVVDSAQPLPEEVLARFLSKDSPSGPEAVGPGLELFVARLLAECLGGSLGYSWAKGHGRFELELPRESSWRSGGRAMERGGIASLLGRIAVRSVRAVRADLSETAPGKGSRGLVLVYDEDPVFLEALKRYLEGRGYAVAPTLSADKAVALAATRPFDLVLLDASSQSRAGLAACARIRASKGMDELPVVVMTDRESAEAVEAAFRAGASDYLPKLSPNELLFARVDTHVALRRAVEDALETRRQVAELEKLKTLGVLAAGVAHEVNTPNNAVIRNIPVISEVWRELSPILRRLMDETEGFSIRGWTAEELVRELPELLADTYSAGLQIKKIVEDLKDYARDSSGSPPEAVDLSAVAAYASRLLAPLVGRSTRRFVLDAPARLPHARANFQKLTQVAVSVLENALQSLEDPEAGVTLRTRFDDGRGRLVLECEDEGRGIRADQLEKVFEPFFTTKRDEGGTGLGLSVARGIVRDAGGEIEIDSRPGRGTIVRVVLPAIIETERGGDERRE